MSKNTQIPPRVTALIKSFKIALKKYFGNCERTRYHKESISHNYYEEAKKAQTQERNLLKALELYTKAIQAGQKKDSSIKDFASSLHQLGYTKEAVRFMDDCEGYYDGNKDKYFRLRDNLEIQIRPTGKHLCRYLLIENVNEDIRTLENQDEIKSLLFKCPKRIKTLKFLEDFELMNQSVLCTKEKANNLLLEFESFSAAKKTLESFYFDEWFGSNLYWVNSSDMRIVCAAVDGKNDFEDGFLINDDLTNEHLDYGGESFWVSFGEKIYLSKESNGFINLLSTHLIKDFLNLKEQNEGNKENIFESSKISNYEQSYKEFQYYEQCIEPMKFNKRDPMKDKRSQNVDQNVDQNFDCQRNWSNKRYNHSYRQQFYYY